jgi:X-Pro dipeptidyl-peptidase
MAVGTLSLTAAADQSTEKFTDNVSVSASGLAAAAASPHRLLYATPPLADTLHISGYPRVTLRLASSKPAVNLSVYLVTLPFDSTEVGDEGRHGVVTRGWADPQNHRALTKGGDYNSRTRGEPLVPGQFYDLTFDLQPDDQRIPAGTRLGLMIFSSDRDFTLWPQPGTELTIDLDRSSLVLPVVGGSNAARRALGQPRSPERR